MNSTLQNPHKSLSIFFVCCLLFISNSSSAQSVLAPFPDICENAGTLVLTGGTPVGGVYLVAGVPSTTFNPATAGVGPHQIGYSCFACTDTVYQTISVIAKPTANFVNPGPFCSNTDSVVLTGGSPVPPPGISFYFGAGVNSSSGKFDPATGSGPIQYVYEDGNGCRDTASVSVVVNNVVAADFTGLDPDYCLEDPSPVTLTGISPLPGTFGPTGSFTGNDFTIPGTPGIYDIYYFYTDGNGCVDTVFKQTEIRPKPAVTFTIDPNQASVCDADLAFPISTTGASPATGTFAGTGVIASPVFDPATAGVGVFRIYYTAQDIHGCENVDSSQFITVNASPTVSFVLPFDSVCSNDAAFLLPNGTINGTPAPGTYGGPGVNASAPFTFTPLLAGPGLHPISFTGMAAGCAATTSRTIKVNAKPTVSFTNTIRKCANDTAFTLNVGLPLGGTYSGVGVLGDGVTYDPTTTTGPGQYQLFYTFTDAFGCTDVNQQFITLDTFPELSFTSVPDPGKICLGDTIELNATSVPASNVAFSWAPNLGDIIPATATGDNIRVFPVEDKTLTLTGVYTTNNCANTMPVPIEVIPTAVASIDGITSLCFGDSSTLLASGATNYEWDGGETTAEIVIKPVWDTTYSVIALSDVDGNGKQCSQDTTFYQVTVNPLPILSAGLDTTAFIGDKLPLVARGASTYVWSGALSSDDFDCLDCPNPVVTVLPELNAKSIMYFVTGTDENGCISNDSINVTIDENVVVFVPTAFSPNNDGANDSLFVRGKSIKSLSFQIFNRRGEEVFATKNINQGWDGTYKGSPLNKEVFVYYLTVTPYFKPTFKQTGSITLVR